MSRPTLRVYESEPLHVKTAKCRRLLDGYYARLARFLSENEADRQTASNGGFDDDDATA